MVNKLMFEDYKEANRLVIINYQIDYKGVVE